MICMAGMLVVIWTCRKRYSGKPFLKQLWGHLERALWTLDVGQFLNGYSFQI